VCESTAQLLAAVCSVVVDDPHLLHLLLHRYVPKAKKARDDSAVSASTAADGEAAAADC
jgi:hypothetical protein